MPETSGDQLALVRQLKNQNRRLETEVETLKGSGGGGTSFPMAEDPLKARVDFLHTAFLALLGLILTAILGLITVIVTTSNASNARSDKSIETISTLNREVGTIATKADESNRRLERIEAKIDQIASKLK